MKSIEFGELRITDLAKKHIQECLEKNWVSIGEKTKEFENRWGQLFGYKHTVMVSSGTTADTACCMSLYDYGAKPGDFIICPALSYIATANAIRAAGFTPLFVDVKKETLNINTDEIENLIKAHNAFRKNIVAIMCVNLMGKPCNLDILSDISNKYNLKLIVDNCEAYGSTFKGKYSLEYADMETTSHYIAHIICCGEGGTVSCKDEELYNILKSIRSHGRQPDSLYFDHIRFGLNFKPTDLHASIGLGEIDDFWKIFIKRKNNLYTFRNAVSGYEGKAYFVEEDEGCINAPHGFSITLKEKYATKKNIDTIKQTLEENNIHWKRNFGSMPHHKAFSYLNYGASSMINAQYIGEYGIHIGCHYWLTDEDIDKVCSTLKLALGKI